MATIRSYTTVEQSKVLAKILPLESADITYCAITKGMQEEMIIKDWQVNIGLDIAIKENLFSYRNGYTIPCWSLAALLKIIPYPELREQYNGNWTCRVSNANTTFLWEDDNPVNACYEMIIKLHKEGLL